MLDRFGLAGRTALVTGCGQGIGFAVAKALAAAGADIIGVNRRRSDSLDQLADEVRTLGRSFLDRQVDLSDLAAVSRLGEELRREQVVDVLVNNAGTIHRQPALDHDPAAWHRVLSLNLTAPFLLTRGLAGGMIERGYGKVIFLASLLSFQGGVTVPSYAAAKSGIAGLTRALANEWAPLGVNVNAVAPGYIETSMTDPLVQDENRRRELTSRIPAGRWGRPDDLGGAVVFLASAASDYVHGVVLPVDGGWLAR